MRQMKCWIVAGLAVAAVCAQAQDVAKFDPRMAMEKAEIDTNGVLNVSAVDLDTGRMQKISLNILGLEQR